MRTKGPSTILLITRDRLVRADFAGGTARISALREERRPAVDDLPSLVEAALRLGTRRPGRVWVLSSDLWTQTLTLRPDTIAGLRQEEINQALGFEAEPFSGISALEAAAASVALPDQDDQRCFWLTEVSAAQLEQVEYVVEQAGGRLTGISHPAGLPRPLAAQPSAQGAWQRAELWPGVIVVVRARSPGRPTIFVRNVDPKPGRWETDAGRWQGEGTPSPHVESLHATSGIAKEELGPEKVVSLEASEGQERFLRAWAEQLATRDGSLPLIRPPKRPMSTGSRRALAAVLGLLALASCIGLHLAFESRRTGLTAETARLKEPADQLSKLKKEADGWHTRQAELAKACQKLSEDLANYQQAMRSQRQRLATMLTVLAHCSTEQMVIRKISGTEDEIVLQGLCLQPESASMLAGALAEALGPQGWQVQPPNRRSREMLAGGGPWEFELRIREPGTTPPGQAASASVVPRPPQGKQP